MVSKRGRRKRRKVIENPDSMPSANIEITDVNCYKAITHFITDQTDFLRLVYDNDLVAPTTHPAICLSGLHTCGDLAPSCLRMFQQSSQIEAICNIGCCYNNLSEQFAHPADATIPSERYRMYEGNIVPIMLPEPDADENRVFGFPMSRYLVERGYALGRNARMLAVQPIHRTVDAMESPHDNLFYRALLEVLIVQEYPNLRNAIHVGRIKKCASFVDYVRKCSKRMTMLDFSHIGDDDIDTFYQQNMPHIKRLSVFHLIRLSLAPIIEAVILLDRLLYLHDGTNTSDEPPISMSVHLIKFFDSILSPRCYGIVAFK